FQKYQIATLDRARELGYVKSYTVVRPALHASEDSRWDYRIVVTFTSPASVSQRVEVERALFPDKATRQREENRRWELVLNHSDLPIREIDPHADPEQALRLRRPSPSGRPARTSRTSLRNLQASAPALAIPAGALAPHARAAPPPSLHLPRPQTRRP